MKKFEVTVLHKGKLHKWGQYSNSASSVRRHIVDHWNSELIYDAKIIKVVQVPE